MRLAAWQTDIGLWFGQIAERDQVLNSYDHLLTTGEYKAFVQAIGDARVFRSHERHVVDLSFDQLDAITVLEYARFPSGGSWRHFTRTSAS